MYELIQQLAKKLALKYSLDYNAMLNENPNIMYMDLGDGLVEFNKKTHLSKCITKEKEPINAFMAIQTLLSCIY